MSLTLLGVGDGGGTRRQGASMAKYLFIDGRYLDVAYNDLIRDFFGCDGDLDIPTVISHFNPHRTYYYNAVDDEQRKDETPEAFKARVAAAIARFEAINALPACHVRYGTITGKAHKKPRRQRRSTSNSLLMRFCTRSTTTSAWSCSLRAIWILSPSLMLLCP